MFVDLIVWPISTARSRAKLPQLSFFKANKIQLTARKNKKLDFSKGRSRIKFYFIFYQVRSKLMKPKTSFESIFEIPLSETEDPQLENPMEKGKNLIFGF